LEGVYITNGTFIELAKQYKDTVDEDGGTLLTSLWCMPDDFLDYVIRIDAVIEAGPPADQNK